MIVERLGQKWSKIAWRHLWTTKLHWGLGIRIRILRHLSIHTGVVVSVSELVPIEFIRIANHKKGEGGGRGTFESENFGYRNRLYDMNVQKNVSARILGFGARQSRDCFTIETIHWRAAVTRAYTLGMSGNDSIKFRQLVNDWIKLTC